MTKIMRIRQYLNRLSLLWYCVLTFMLVLTLFISIASHYGFLNKFGYWIGAILLASALTWLVTKVIALSRQKTLQQNQIKEIEKSLALQKNYIAGILLLNQSMINAQNEKELVDSALEIIAGLVGAKACSFIPLDEIGQSLPAYTFGNLPANDSTIWTDKLTSVDVRQRCKICKINQPAHDDNCPFLDEPMAGDLNLYCISMKKDQKIQGMLNLYIPADIRISEDQISFMEDLLTELSNAIQTIRLRNQELATLRQMQSMNSSKAELSNLLDCLLEGLQNALDVDSACVYVQPLDEWQPEIRLKRGDLQIDDVKIN